MPKKAIDYSKCCIYKIEHITDETLVYVGHTTNFKQRKSHHKSSCNLHYLLYKTIRENGGWNMFRMIEIEKYPCKDRREAEGREYELVRKLKATMNTIGVCNEEKNNEIAKLHEEYIIACKSNRFFSSEEDKLPMYIKCRYFHLIKMLHEKNKKLYDKCMNELLLTF